MSHYSRTIRQVFLSIPVQGQRLPNEHYERLVDVLHSNKLNIVNPAVMDPPSPEETYLYSAQDINTGNLELLALSDMCIAEVSTPSHGVGYEIAIAEYLGLPILCVYQHGLEKHLSLMIRGSSSHRVRLRSYESIADLNTLVSGTVAELERSGDTEVLAIDAAGYSRRVAKHFDNIAQVYDISADWRNKEDILAWFETVLSESTTCIEVGTGTGLVAERLQDKGVIAIGVDRSLKMLRLAQIRLGTVVRADATKLPFCDSQFDGVALRQVLHYVDDETCLEEIARVTIPNGYLASAHIAAPNDEVAAWWGEVKELVQPLRRRFYTENRLVELVAQAGFAVKQVDTLGLTRRDTWERFFLNCSPQGVDRVHCLLHEVPESIRSTIKLDLSASGISYNQNWILVLGQRR